MAHLPRQDMPPPGGFGEFAFQRHLPKKGFGSLTVLFGVCAISAVGMQQYIYYQRIENTKRLARINERRAFLERLDRHLYQKYLERVKTQAELDVIAMDKLLAGEPFHQTRPAEPVMPAHGQRKWFPSLYDIKATIKSKTGLLIGAPPKSDSSSASH